MGKPLILTFDCGTQSIRAMLFDKDGELVAKAKVSFPPYFSDSPGYAEQHPEFYWQKLCQAAQSAKRANEDIWGDIVGVTVTTMRDTMINLDKNGVPVRPAIVWLDTREAKFENKIPLKSRLAFALSGMSSAVNMNGRHSKSNWIWENEKETWEKTDKYVQLSGYIAYKLTGKFVDSVAAQIGHIPFNYKNKKWNKDSDIKNCIFNVPRRCLCELLPAGEVLGTISEAAQAETGINKGIKVIASGSDKGCETLGTGCIGEDAASLSFGTTSTVQLTLEKYLEPQAFLPAYPAVYPNCYNPEIEIFRGYWMVTWFKNEFAASDIIDAEKLDLSPEEFLNQKLMAVPPGADGLVLSPYWGPGLKNPEARGAIIGFNAVHTRAHLYRAIIEGINYGLIDGLSTLERRGKFKVKTLTVSGGGSQSDVICQITADMFNRTVKRVQTYETSGLGSSIAGFVGAGEFTCFSEAIKSMVHYTDVFTPNREVNKIYAAIYENVYSSIYPKLKNIFLTMKKMKI